MEKIRLGIIGVGNMGSSHAVKLYNHAVPEICLTAVCDIKPERLEWAGNTFGDGVALFDNAEKMMDSGLIDAVCIAVPHYYHPTYAITALEKGLHVMIEKPAGVYTAQVKEMIAVADKHRELTFAIMMNQRTNCLYRKMHEIVASGEMGELKRSNWIITDWFRSQFYYDSGDWRATWSGEGGGVLLNQCPHNLDLWQWICGMPVKVKAQMHFGKWHDIEVEDDVSAYAEYANGATGVFITSTGDCPGTNRLELTLERGKMVAEDGKLTVWKTKDNVLVKDFLKTSQSPWDRPETVMEEVELDGENPQHMGVFKQFAGHILRGEPLVADGREGLYGLTLSNGMHLSAFLGKTIDLTDFDDGLFKQELDKRIAEGGHKANIINTVCEDMSKSFEEHH